MKVTNFLAAISFIASLASIANANQPPSASQEKRPYQLNQLELETIQHLYQLGVLHYDPKTQQLEFDKKFGQILIDKGIVGKAFIEASQICGVCY